MSADTRLGVADIADRAAGCPCVTSEPAMPTEQSQALIVSGLSMSADIRLHAAGVLETAKAPGLFNNIKWT